MSFCSDHGNFQSRSFSSHLPNRSAYRYRTTSPPLSLQYITYGPLLNRTHTLLFEGTPTHPGPERLWATIEKHKATTLYTAPTALRALMVHGDEPVRKHDLSSLRLLGSVGEPIGPEVRTGIPQGSNIG